MSLLKKRMTYVSLGLVVVSGIFASYLGIGRMKKWFSPKESISLRVSYNPDMIPLENLLHLQAEFAKMHDRIEFDNQISIHTSDKTISEMDEKADVYLTSVDHGRILQDQQRILDDFSESAFHDFHPKAVEMVHRDGVMTGVPLFFSNYIVMYSNRKMMSDVPKTLGELENLVSPFHAPSSGRYGLSAGMDAYMAIPFLWANDYYKQLKDPSKAEDSAVKAFDILQKLYLEKNMLPGECSSSCAVELFVSGQAPVLFAGEWKLSQLRTALPSDLAVDALPALGEDQGHLGSPINGLVYYFAAAIDTSKKNLAEDWLLFLTNQTSQKFFWETMHKVPAKPKKVFQEQVQDRNLLTGLLRAIDKSFFLQKFQDTELAILSIEPVLTQLYAGKISPQLAAKQIKNLP